VCFIYLECDVITPDADLQLLFSDDIFLWPVCVVFPLKFFKWGKKKCHSWLDGGEGRRGKERKGGEGGNFVCAYI
jgi:hypothetical protein